MGTCNAELSVGACVDNTGALDGGPCAACLFFFKYHYHKPPMLGNAVRGHILEMSMSHVTIVLRLLL